MHEIESAVLDDWYVIGSKSNWLARTTLRTQLLNSWIEVARNGEDVFESSDPRVKTCCAYGLVWATLGNPEQGVPSVPEALEPNRRVVYAGALAGNTSGLRIIENFLDMGHFPFVHEGYLGVEPLTDVAPYEVEKTEDGGLITVGATFPQPKASATAEGINRVELIYRVSRPYSAQLYRSRPDLDGVYDVIVMFVQPCEEERCIAHAMLVFAKGDDGETDAQTRAFQQLIFAQDLTILTNHVPRTLPIGHGVEVPTKTDKMSAAYRRYLMHLGVNFGTYRIDSHEFR